MAVICNFKSNNNKETDRIQTLSVFTYIHCPYEFFSSLLYEILRNLGLSYVTISHKIFGGGSPREQTWFLGRQAANCDIAMGHGDSTISLCDITMGRCDVIMGIVTSQWALWQHNRLCDISVGLCDIIMVIVMSQWGSVASQWALWHHNKALWHYRRAQLHHNGLCDITIVVICWPVLHFKFWVT